MEIRKIEHISKLCFFCDNSSGVTNILHEVMTLQVDQRVSRLATITKDTRILAKIAGDDMIATEAVYHNKYLSPYYNRERSFDKTSEKSAEGIRKGIALAELISYMEGQRIEGKKVSKLSDLVLMYTDRLNELGVDQRYQIIGGVIGVKYDQKMGQSDNDFRTFTYN